MEGFLEKLMWNSFHQAKKYIYRKVYTRQREEHVQGGRRQ